MKSSESGFVRSQRKKVVGEGGTSRSVGEMVSQEIKGLSVSIVLADDESDWLAPFLVREGSTPDLGE